MEARWMPFGVVAIAIAGLMSCAGSEPTPPSVPDTIEIIAEPAAVSPNPSGQTQPLPPPGPVDGMRPRPHSMPQPPSFMGGEFTQGGWARIQLPSRISAATLDGEPVKVSADGRILIAFDRDAAPEAKLEYEGFSSTLSIAARQWQISRVNVPKRSGGSSEAWWKKRKPEWEAIVAARAKETGAQGWRQDFVWPVKGRISGLFGRQRIYQGEPGSYHSGIDIAPGHGVPFVAPADGVVVLARAGFSLEGGLIILDHGGGLNSAFLHSSKILVEEGQAVRQGDRIGHVGSTGRATGPHLHWSLKWNDARLDPLLFTGPMNP